MPNAGCIVVVMQDAVVRGGTGINYGHNASPSLQAGEAQRGGGHR